MDTYLLLCNSIGNIPELCTFDDILAYKPEITKDYRGVESCWIFLYRSGAQCHALRAKFIQLRALKRLCRMGQRDFLIW